MSNSIGNLKNSGNQGNNFPWQLKMLLGQQCTCDELQAINANTDNLEFLLTSILTTLQASTEYEAKFVIDTCDSDKVYLEVRIWNPDTSTWGPISYYTPGSSTPVTPAGAGTPGCLQYTDPSGILAQILAVLQDIELGIPEALGQTTMSGSMPVVIASDQTGIPVTDNGGSLTVDGTVSLSTATLTALENITVQNGPGAAAVNIQDGGNSITVDAVDLDIRNLTCTDQITLCNGGLPVDATNPLPVNAIVTVPTPLPVSQDPTSNPWIVDATGSDVTVSNTVTVQATDLDVRNLTFATDSVDVSGSNVNATITGPLGVQADCANAVSTALCQTQEDILSDIKTAVQGTLDVNILSSIELEVNLDPNNDAVTIYGSNPTVPVSTDGAGHLQVDVLTIPEVEIKNDAGNPIPVLQQYPGTVPYASCEVATGTGTTPVVFSAGATSMSVQNIGNDNITVDTDASTGVILPPGVSITWDAPVGQRFDTFTFTGSSVSSLFIVTAVIAS